MLKYICSSYKKELFEGIHNSTHDYYIALFNNEQNIFNIQSYYDLKNEIAGRGYTPGGKKLDGINIILDDDVAILSFNTVVWPNVSLAATGALIYNFSLPSRNAIFVIDFEKTYSINDGDFIIEFPPANKENGFIRII